MRSTASTVSEYRIRRMAKAGASPCTNKTVFEDAATTCFERVKLSVINDSRPVKSIRVDFSLMLAIPCLRSTSASSTVCAIHQYFRPE